MPGVLSSRRFWTFLVAQLIGIASFVGAHYLSDPFQVQLLTLVIGLVEGMAAILIAAYTVEDVTIAKNQ